MFDHFKLEGWTVKMDDSPPYATKGEVWYEGKKIHSFPTGCCGYSYHIITRGETSLFEISNSTSNTSSVSNYFDTEGWVGEEFYEENQEGDLMSIDYRCCKYREFFESD